MGKHIRYWGILLALLLMATPLAAQPLEPLRIISARQISPEQLELIVACEQTDQRHDFTLSLDSGRPSPTLSGEPYALPLSAALIMDMSQAMRASGTPHSSSFSDMRLQIDSLVARLPADSSLAMLGFAADAQLLLPLRPDRAVVRAQLGQIAPQETPALSDTLGLALELGLQQLRDAPEGPRALIMYAASAPITAAQIAELKPKLGDIELLIIGHSPASEEALSSLANELGGNYLAYHTSELARLPELLQATQAAYTKLMDQRRHLRILAPTNSPESGLRLQGCGGQASAVIENRDIDQTSILSQESSLAFGGGILLAGASLALIGQIRKRIGQPNRQNSHRRRSSREAVGSFQRGLDQPTERKITKQAVQEQSGYKLTIWDGNQRSSYMLEQRQCVIGRNVGCDLRINNRWISMLHARLSIVGNAIEIEDLGSSNGTFIGSHRQELAAQHLERLSVGDEIWLGPEVQIVIHQRDYHE